MAAEVKRATQNDMIDLMAWKHYGKTVGRVERILEDPANYGLCDRPELLEAGTKVTMPDIVEPIVVHTVKLWD